MEPLVSFAVGENSTKPAMEDTNGLRTRITPLAHRHPTADHHSVGSFHASLNSITTVSIGTILLIVLIIILLGGFSGIGGGPFYGTGYYGGRGIGLVVVILLILVLLGRISGFEQDRR